MNTSPWANNKSDKIYHHGFHRFYPFFLHHLEGQDSTLLEVGIDRGDSLDLWEKWLPDTKVYGADIETPDFENPRIHTLDQSSDAELQAFASQFTNFFDVIIDDGSHVPDHQILTLQRLWQCLKPRGIYIVEDIETNYWGKSSIYKYPFNARSKNLLKFLSGTQDIINNEFSGVNNNSWKREIETLTYAHNCIILTKKSPEFNRFYNRTYRFQDQIDQRSLKSRIIRKLRRIFKISPYS